MRLLGLNVPLHESATGTPDSSQSEATQPPR